MAFRTVSTSLRVRRRKEKQRGYYQRGMRAAKAFLSFYSPPKPRALLPIRLVDTARDVNEMQRGIRLASHVMSVCVQLHCSLWLFLKDYHSWASLLPSLFCLQVPVLRFHFCLVSVHSPLSSTSCLTLSYRAIYTILCTYYFSLACLCSLSLAGFSALICSGTPHSSVAVAPCLHPRSRRFHGFTQSLR